jgi:hypothetical protein
MNIPPMNIASMRLVALWVIFIILVMMGWHFTMRQL